MLTGGCILCVVVPLCYIPCLSFSYGMFKFDQISVLYWRLLSVMWTDQYLDELFLIGSFPPPWNRGSSRPGLSCFIDSNFLKINRLCKLTIFIIITGSKRNSSTILLKVLWLF